MILPKKLNPRNFQTNQQNWLGKFIPGSSNRYFTCLVETTSGCFSNETCTPSTKLNHDPERKWVVPAQGFFDLHSLYNRASIPI